MNPIEITKLQRNTLDTDNLIAYAWRTRKYFSDAQVAIDIGCGIGYQTEQIAKLNPNCQITMLDKTGIEDRINFSEKGYAHNDLNLTREYIQDYNCLVYDIDAYAWDTQADVVYSTLSWGWHYPVDLYIDKVLAINPKYIIFDCRDKNPPVITNYNKCDSFRINRKENTIVYQRLERND